MRKSTSNWYTPDYILDKVAEVFPDGYHDPCPIAPTNDGLNVSWSGYKGIYCNPPIPAQVWATKCLHAQYMQLLDGGSMTPILFAAFSPAVFFQQPAMLQFPICWVRNRVKWVDGRELITKLVDNAEVQRPNPNYLKAATGSNQYSAFVMMTDDALTLARFKQAFAPMGEINQRCPMG